MITLIAAAMAAATAQPAPAATVNPHAQHPPGMAMAGMGKDAMAKGAMADEAMDCACCKDMAKDHAKMGDHAMPSAPQHN